MHIQASSILMPQPVLPRYTVDPVAFFLALIGGPLMFTLLTFWLLFIPVFALWIGGPLYLLIGVPMLLHHLGRHPCVPGDIAQLAMYGVLLILPLSALGALAFQSIEILSGGIGMAAFGLMIAPGWGYFFAVIYKRLCRDFYAHPRRI